MLSLIEVTCPHCGVQGQILLPPLGAIIVGPCPECGGMVAIYCGRVLPLDQATMESGTQADRRAHLGDVLGTYLRERIDRLFADSASGEEEDESASANGFLFEDIEEELAVSDAGRIVPFGAAPSVPITNEEVDSFKNVDLKLLDNADYFRAVFK